MASHVITSFITANCTNKPRISLQAGKYFGIRRKYRRGGTLNYLRGEGSYILPYLWNFL